MSGVPDLYHRHGRGLDLVPGNNCIDPEQDPQLILAFTPDDLATYVERHMARALREAADRMEKLIDATPPWHALIDVAPRKLRAWASEVEAEGTW